MNETKGQLSASGVEDPVDAGENKELAAKAEMIEERRGLTLDDFKSIPAEAARVPDPFEGFPWEYTDVTVYDENGNPEIRTICTAHIVRLQPHLPVFQDPSGQNKTIWHKAKPKSHKELPKETGDFHIETIKSYHNRVVKGSDGRNMDIVFDRELELSDGQKVSHVAIVEDPLIRAQIVFALKEKTGNVVVDNRYQLADSRQRSRLRTVFLHYHNPRIKKIRQAQFISGESDDAQAAGMEG
jgi:hypothetical protein